MTYPKAFQFAVEAHSGKLWKDGRSPFLVHPMRVMANVLKFGGSHSQAIAGLVHDAALSTPDLFEAAVREFGPEVESILRAFQDPVVEPETDWIGIRKAYLQQCETVSAEAYFVIACEELDEVSDFLMDYRGTTPLEAWQRFPVSKLVIFWYYREILRITYRHKENQSVGDFTRLASELAAKLKSLQQLVFEGHPPTETV